MTRAQSADVYADVIEDVQEEIRAQAPQPYPEDPPLVDALAAHVCWACSRASHAIERVDKMQDELDERT